MHVSLGDIERESYMKSPIHRLDGWIKIIITLLMVVYTVSLPRAETANFIKLGILELYLLSSMIVARLDLSYLALRFAMALPFGLGIAVIQPFFRQSFFTDFTVLYSLTPGLEITKEGLIFGAILFAKFFVCISSVILLSSTTSMSELVASARRLGLPREMALLFTMMVRYLFVFWNMLGRIRTAQKTRCFNIWNKKVPRKWTLEQVGYTISSLFIRSYEQGERTYQSMLCRGYNAEVPVYIGKKYLSFTDVLVLLLTISIIAVAQVAL